MTEFETHFDNYLTALDYSKLRLMNAPNFLFLCGGQTGTYETGQEGESKYFSMRGAILDTIVTSYASLSDKVQYAEEYQDWLEHGQVKNLIDFELAIADMAGAIVLVLEGPGAFAELGSFSVLETLSEKLILVVNTNIVEEKTFINYGPIKYLQDNNKVVLKYQWDVRYYIGGVNQDKVSSKVNANKETTLSVSNRITKKIQEEVGKLSTGSPKLDVNKIGHVCFVVGDLIFTFGALRISEINNALKNHFEIKSNYSLVRTCVYILERFGFIKKVDNGDTYYIATNENKGFIKHYYDSELKELIDNKNRMKFMQELLLVMAVHDEDRLTSITGN
ncbi:type II secretion protein [Vibrio parahaemolyticus]|nr:type II secretion protein [Vibrio parahaemolyticus]EGQ8609309.1 type II secretion protein [Vibrio parahaemolyticus]MBE4244714.1 type II secretion protein [Vibrio parahaemolyticus]HAS7001470.1 type II secretion protein [Vibrio parahaemolyticus]HAS7003844.1 type II secretion protein [Vibrio parahaemolyticus]